MMHFDLASDESAPPQVRALNAVWLVRLRWLAVMGQLATVLFASLLLTTPLPLGPLLAIIAFTAVSNAALAAWLQGRRSTDDLGWQPWMLTAVMTLDLLSLTALLYFTGGARNPFAIFYLVNLALAGIVLPRRWAWSLLAVAAACFVFAMLSHRTVPELTARSAERGLSLWEQGSVAAFLTCALVTTYFVTRLTKELRRRESELLIAEQQRARSQRLEALATLAAGAGHELATPLSTIAVVAKELSRHLTQVDAPDSVHEDVALIRSELDHCRNILRGMAGHAGQIMGEEVARLSLGDFLDETLAGLRRAAEIDLQITASDRDEPIQLPIQSVAQALRGVLQNGLDASPAGHRVHLAVKQVGDAWALAVRDEGSGMTAQVLERAGEPFFTTKEPGQGMGMGLFLARSVVERLGGEMQLESTPTKGSTVTLILPA